MISLEVTCGSIAALLLMARFNESFSRLIFSLSIFFLKKKKMADGELVWVF